MLGQRRRRWANIEPTHGQCPVFAGYPEGIKLDLAPLSENEVSKNGRKLVFLTQHFLGSPEPPFILTEKLKKFLF